MTRARDTANIVDLPDAKGDLFAATAADTPARLAIGNDGETLVADSSATTGLRYSATPSASNPVLNSAMQVWQRGTSISIAASTSLVYTADRWETSTNANQACTVSRQATGDTTNLPNIQYAMRFQRNSGQTGTGGVLMTQTLETVNSIPYAGKTVTLSFYARAGANYSAASSALVPLMYSGTGTDQNILSGLTGSTNPINSTVTLTTTWQRFTVTSTAIPTTSTQIGLAFYYTPTGTAGVNDYYEVTGVQIDVGSVALPFRTYAATIQGELAACQRYYFRTNASGNAYTQFGYGNTWSTTDIMLQVKLPVSMRTKPATLETNSLLASDGYNNLPITSPTLAASSTPDLLFFTGTVSGATAYRPYQLCANASTSAYVGVSSEL
jgi:hypothetical protein